MIDVLINGPVNERLRQPSAVQCFGHFLRQPGLLCMCLRDVICSALMKSGAILLLRTVLYHIKYILIR